VSALYIISLMEIFNSSKNDKEQLQ